MESNLYAGQNDDLYDYLVCVNCNCRIILNDLIIFNDK
jgi:hypothetical protein